MQSPKGTRSYSKTKPPESMMTSLLDKVVKDKTMALLHSPDVTAWLQGEQRKRKEYTRVNAKRHSNAVSDCSEAASNRDISTTTQDQSPVLISPLNFCSSEKQPASAEHCCERGTNIKHGASDIQANIYLADWTHGQRNQSLGELSVPSKEGSAFKKFTND